MPETMNQPLHDTADSKATISALRAAKAGHYRKLPKELRRGGFTYRQIWRDGEVAIYQQSWSASDEPSECFEVIKIRVDPGRELRGKWLEAAERYPGSEDWGNYGWTYTDRDLAIEKAKSL